MLAFSCIDTYFLNWLQCSGVKSSLLILIEKTVKEISELRKRQRTLCNKQQSSSSVKGRPKQQNCHLGHELLLPIAFPCTEHRATGKCLVGKSSRISSVASPYPQLQLVFIYVHPLLLFPLHPFIFCLLFPLPCSSNGTYPHLVPDQAQKLCCYVVIGRCPAYLSSQPLLTKPFSLCRFAIM